VTVTVDATPSATPPSGGTVVGTPYTFGPEGTAFATPVTVTVDFDPLLLPAGARQSDVLVYTAPAGTDSFTSLASTAVDLTHVSAQVTHFSVFVAFVPSVLPSADGGASADAGAGPDTGSPGDSATDSSDAPSTVDAGASDATSPDAGATDANAPDAGTTDAGPTDASSPDAEPLDAGSDVAIDAEIDNVLGVLRQAEAVGYSVNVSYVS